MDSKPQWEGLTAAIAAVLVLGAGLTLADETAADAPDGCFEDVPRSDVGFVLDESGSMGGDKIGAAKEGATNLTDLLTDGQYSGLVSFDSSAYLRKAMGPDHNVTASEIEALTAGGGTATGDGIDLSHQDILDNGLSDGRDIMVVLADGNTNAGSDPVTQADEAKADGIEVFAIAFGDGADEAELKQIASDPTEDYFFDASTDDIQEVFLRIAENVTALNDTQAPSLNITVPQEGHRYVKGQDQGPGTSEFADRATIVGDMSFEALADDNCYLEEVAFDVPGTGFSYAENATNVTTDPFPASSVFSGNYTLNVTATDWLALSNLSSRGLFVPDLDPPQFTEGPCATGETVDGIAGEPLSFPVSAESPEDVNVTFSLVFAPSGVLLEGDFPDNPANATVEWPDPTPGGHSLEIEAEDALGLTTTCQVDLDIVNPPPTFLEPSPCVTDEAVTGIEDVELSFDVRASSPVDNRTVSLVEARLHPAGLLQLDAEPPANPVNGTVTWASPEVGVHSATVVAEDSYGNLVECPVEIRIEEARAETRVIGLWAGTATPENVEYRTEGVHRTDTGADGQAHATLSEGQDLFVEGLEERGNVSYQAPTLTSSGYSQAAEVRLLGGLVTAEGLTHNATLTWDLVQETGRIATEQRSIARLEVAGQPIDLENRTGTVNVSLPGDGYVHLFERNVTRTEDGITYRSNLVHVYAPDAYGGGETIVGDVRLEAPSATPTPQSRQIEEQDDADSGRDAGNRSGQPVEIGPGLYDGTFVPGDLVDRYALQARHGEKIKVNLEPANRAAFRGGQTSVAGGQPSGDGPSVFVERVPLSIRLYDPAGELRAHSILGPSSEAQSVELNADVDGAWTVEIERFRDFDADRYSFYSFDLTVTPVPLLPQNDALSGSDAPASCQVDEASIPEIHDGQWPGVLKHDDHDDVYRFHADVGDLATASLKPGETTDGVDMGLYLYDQACSLLDESHLGGPYTLKGVPEAVVEVPSDYTGTYFLRVERVNGVGNHHVTLSVRDPMPGLPTNDARTGQDADGDPSNPTPAPPLAFQGTLRDGDAGDAYALSMTEGNQSHVVLEMSAASQVDADLYRPSGLRLTHDVNVLRGTYAWSFDAPETGDYVLVVQPLVGGGDYTVTWGQVPTALLPGPLGQSAVLPGASTSP